MKRALHKRILAITLVLTMLLPNLTGLLQVVQADTITYGEPEVYDIYRLTGSETNTLKGTDETWDGQPLGQVSPEHKENIVFKTRLTMGAQQVRLALNAKDGTSIYDPPGYAVYINDNNGAPYIAIKRNQQDLVVGSVASVKGTYELEIGIVDILSGGNRVGKHLYVKKDGAVICEADDTNGYLTGDALGTKVIDFHYGAAIQMDTTGDLTEPESSEPETTTPETSEPETEFQPVADTVVYDIYDLTGAAANVINGTGKDNWSATVLGNIDADDKESVSLKANVNIQDEAKYRFSLGALATDNCVDPAGYGMEVVIGTSGSVVFMRGSSHTQIKSWSADTTNLKGEYVLEFGYRDILFNDNVIGKQIFLMKDGEVLYSYDDVSGYLTGDALGTKVAIFHYGSAIQMDTTYESTYGTANVYDVFDLTGVAATKVDPWVSTKIGSIAAEDKERVAIKLNMNITDARHRYRFSVGAAEGADCTDPHGYGVEIAVQFDGSNHIRFTRGSGSEIAIFSDVSPLIGEHAIEFGYRNITMGDQIAGKQIYLSVDGVEVYTYNDASGYLTGDALGTMVALHHIDDSAVQLESTYESSYGTAKVYDIYDLSGVTAVNVDPWVSTKIGSIAAEDMEQAAVKMHMNITDARHRYRFSVGAAEGVDCTDPHGYGVEIAVQFDGSNHIRFTRGSGSEIAIFSDVSPLIGEHAIEFGYRNITMGSNIAGKQIYLSVDGVEVYTYNDANGYLTGDALGTMVALHHIDDSAVQLESTYESNYGTAKVYDIYDLTGAGSNTINGTGKDNWSATVLGNINNADKESVSLKANVNIQDEAKYRFSLGALESDDCVDPAGYGMELQIGASGSVVFMRGSSHTQIKSWSADTTNLKGEYMLEFGYRDIIFNGNVIGKQIFLMKDGEVLYSYDDVSGYLTGDGLGTKAAIFHYGAVMQMNSTKVTEPTEPEQEIGPQTVADATVYDLYDLKGTSQLTIAGQLQGAWGTTLGYVDPAHKSNVAFAVNITVDQAQTIMLGLGLGDMSQAVQLTSGYVLEIVNKTGEGEMDTVKIHRAGNQIYCKDQSVDFHGKHALEFGMVDILANNTVIGKRLYVKLDGAELFCYDDKAGFLAAEQLGTKIDIYVSGNSLLLESPRNYTAVDANVYDLYDLAFRETLKINHSDDSENVIWGTLIGNVEEAHKGNVALKTKVDMRRDQQQNLLIGLGLQSHWPVGGGLGYQIELNANPDNKNDSLFIYKKSDTGESVCCFNAEQNFDFNASFQLEVGVVDLLDGDKKVAARRIYVKINGEELMHFDDTKNTVSGESMGTVVAAYASSGSVTLGTCVDGIPSTDVKIYDIYDLLGRASVKLNRTDAGGAVIWTNILGQITATNNLNYGLRVNMDTSKVDRSAMQELILGLCKDYDLFDKMGYRLSMYFGTDGGTSLVLRDSATDQVLASIDGAFPQKYVLELGITDFFGSNKKMLGKKVYLKVDGEEVLSYLDKDTNRARGNLLCAYTTSLVTMTTEYSYITIPVTYVVNGETVDSSKYITVNTDVIAGKKSVIDIALGNKDAFTSVLMEQVLLNGQPITAVSDKQDVYLFELENPSKDDRMTVQIQVHSLTVDEAEVYDLYELTGKNKITISANSVDQIGTLFADGQEGVLNRAIRFAYYIPKTGGGLRLGYGSDTTDIWSRVGTHIELWCGFATISHGFHVSALSSSNTEIFKANSWSIVEVGIVKCYEDGVYKYDRWYVKAGSTLEDMELITYYDSTQRYDSTLNIMARTPDTGGDFILASTLDVKQVTDVSEETAKAEAGVTFKPLFLKGESVKIVVFPKEGKMLESLCVNGKMVEAVLTSDSGYVFIMENVEEDVQFSYILSDDERLFSITAEDAANLQVILDKPSVSAGGSATVQIKVDGGYTLKSLDINDVDFLPMARYDKTTLTYTLTISGIREDKHIQAQAEKISQDSPVADGATEEKESTNLPVIVAVTVLCVAVLGGVIAVVATRAKKKGRKQ